MSVPGVEQRRVLPTDVGSNLPADPTYYYTEGLKAYSLEQNTARASELFGQAIKLDPSHSPSYYAMANNIAEQDISKALEYSRRANELDSTNVW